MGGGFHGEKKVNPYFRESEIGGLYVDLLGQNVFPVGKTDQYFGKKGRTMTTLPFP